MRISVEKAEMCLRLLLEGMSIRSIQRVTGLHQETILNLLVFAGDRCRELMNKRIKNVPVKDVEADEIWGFVGMKKMNETIQAGYHDACRRCLYVCRYRAQHKVDSRMALGHRDAANTEAFTEKLSRATCWPLSAKHRWPSGLS